MTLYQWIGYPWEKRREAIEHFGIKRSGIVQVVDNQIADDGVTDRDLVSYTDEELVNFLTNAKPYVKTPIEPEPRGQEVASSPSEPVSKPGKRGRPRKNPQSVPLAA